MSSAPNETELKMKFGSLIRELGEAKLHLFFYKKLCEAQVKYGKECLES
jgi:hypothetical protein